jgi:thiamine-phosphate pyrophosphorylase
MLRVKRLLDANSNRAREAMRVMEDAARFLLDDPKLARELKQLRHDFAAAVVKLPGLEIHRDTPGDVGTAITTAAEKQRRSVRDVLLAAGKRLTEALRCLEEYGKLYSPDFAAAIKQLRYRAYALEQQVLRRVPAFRGWRLCVILTESLCKKSWRDVARGAIDAGADCIQLREKSLEGGEWLDRAAALVEMGSGRTDIVVNDRPDIALLAGAAGVHVGQADLSPDAVRKIGGAELAIGLSTHNLAEARRGVETGADYCGVGAMFPTRTKATANLSGLKYLRAFRAKYPAMPHLAIGGIDAENVKRVVDAGARGVAVSSTVCGAANPGAVVKKLLRAIPKL